MLYHKKEFPLKEGFMVCHLLESNTRLCVVLSFDNDTNYIGTLTVVDYWLLRCPRRIGIKIVICNEYIARVRCTYARNCNTTRCSVRPSVFVYSDFWLSPHGCFVLPWIDSPSNPESMLLLLLSISLPPSLMLTTGGRPSGDSDDEDCRKTFRVMIPWAFFRCDKAPL